MSFWHNGFVVCKVVAASAASSSFNLQYEDFSSLLYFSFLFYVQGCIDFQGIMLLFLNEVRARVGRGSGEGRVRVGREYRLSARIICCESYEIMQLCFGFNQLNDYL